MKIAVYIPTASFFVGGGEVVPLMQAKYLTKRGHDVCLIVLKATKQSVYFRQFIKENKNIKVIYLSPQQFRYDVPFEKREVNHKLGHELYLNLSRSASDFFASNTFDVVITHYGPAAISVPRSIKQILILHGVPHKKQLINLVATRVADKLVAVSNSVGQGWVDMFNFPQKIETIHNGIDEKKYFPRENQQKDIDVFFVGRLIKIKGVQHLIKAVNLVRKNKEDLNVVIGGKGPWEIELKKLVKKLKLEEIVKFKGYINDEDLVNYYNRSKICVFPSYAKEGVLTTMLEAASSGRAIITANCCGMVDFIKNGVNGLLFEPQNYKQLASKINLLMQDSSLRKKLGLEARKSILKAWTWDLSIKKLEKAINKLI